MTIKEVEERTGLDRGNIRFYEKEGLLDPQRLENGYRDYSEEDVQILLRIKLLRSLHISLEEIRGLKAGEGLLIDTLTRQIAQLEREKRDAESAQTICRAMVADEVTFDRLDAEKYLTIIPKQEREMPNSYFSVASDMEPQAFCPWRRFLARMLDLAVYSLVWVFLLVFLFKQPLSQTDGIIHVMGTIFAMGVMVLLEPLLLHKFGTTIGKFCFGLRIEDTDGTHLRYSDAFARTVGVLVNGLCLRIPFLEWYFLWRSYKRCTNNEPQLWEEDIPVNYTFKDSDFRCGVRYALGYGVVLGITVLLVLFQRMAPNRGDVTVAQFAENYNYYANYMGITDRFYWLDEDGGWQDTQQNAYYSVSMQNSRPEFLFDLDENGCVTGVSFTREARDEESGLFSLREDEMFLASLAFVSAQEELGLVSSANAMDDLAKFFEDVEYSFGETHFEQSFAIAGLELGWTVEQEGYFIVYGGYLYSDGSAEEPYCRQTFSVLKTES